MRITIIEDKEYTEYDLICPECGSNMYLRKSRFGLFYGCQEFETEGCKGRISADKDGTPFELPSDQQTKKSRVIASEYFEKLWKYGNMNQQQAFSWATKKMNKSRSSFYIANFSIAECEFLVKQIRHRIKNCSCNYETSQDS